MVDVVLEGRRGVGSLGDEIRRGCFIATTVYGDENTPEVLVLRDFRDHVLMESWLGRKVVDVYYGGVGERIAELIRGRFPSAVPAIRNRLENLVGKYAKQDM